MPDNHVYRIIQVAGSSENSIEDAIQNAVGRASAHYQVTVKVGFTLDDDD